MDTFEKILVFGGFPGLICLIIWAIFIDGPNEKQRMKDSAAAQGCIFVEPLAASPRLFYAECDGKIELRRVK